MILAAMIERAGKMHGGVVVSLIGWIVMAYAILNLGARLDGVQFGMLVLGFGMLEGGMALMIWTEH